MNFGSKQDSKRNMVRVGGAVLLMSGGVVGTLGGTCIEHEGTRVSSACWKSPPSFLFWGESGMRRQTLRLSCTAPGNHKFHSIGILLSRHPFHFYRPSLRSWARFRIPPHHLPPFGSHSTPSLGNGHCCTHSTLSWWNRHWSCSPNLPASSPYLSLWFGISAYCSCKPNCDNPISQLVSLHRSTNTVCSWPSSEGSVCSFQLMYAGLALCWWRGCDRLAKCWGLSGDVQAIRWWCSAHAMVILCLHFADDLTMRS